MSRFRTLRTGLAPILVLIAFTSSAMAFNGNNGDHGNQGDKGDKGASVPEIDPNSIGSALALFGFGATMLLDRRRRN